MTEQLILMIIGCFVAAVGWFMTNISSRLGHVEKTLSEVSGFLRGKQLSWDGNERRKGNEG